MGFACVRPGGEIPSTRMERKKDGEEGKIYVSSSADGTKNFPF
jgi:hypothetical protein